MKKIFVICFSTMLFSWGAKAQISYGVKGGLNISTIRSSVKEAAESLTGFHIGGLVNYSVSKKFALQAELLYSNQGYRYQLGGPDLFAERHENIHLNYINVPLIAQYYIVADFYVEAGPQFGILATEKGMLDGSLYKSTDFSAVAGAGYIFKKINLGIGARYTYSLSNISKHVDGEDDMTDHNRVFQLGVFYKFGKKK